MATDNQNPTFGTDTSQPAVNSIIAGEFPRKMGSVTLLSGQNLGVGAVLGRIDLGGSSSAAKSGGNTGNGTLTLDATAPVGVGGKTGVYQVRFIAAATNNGTFRVTDPDGFHLGDVVMAGGAGVFDNDIKFAVADGSTDFIVGDGFDITIAAGSGKYKLAVAAAVDGSARARRILAKDVDASGGDKLALCYETGEFAKNKLVFGAGHTSSTVEADLRSENIYLNDTLPA